MIPSSKFVAHESGGSCKPAQEASFLSLPREVDLPRKVGACAKPRARIKNVRELYPSGKQMKMTTAVILAKDKM